MNKFFLLTFSLFLSLASVAQKSKNVPIKGKVLDQNDDKALFMASISIRKSADSSLVTFGFTNESGEFNTPGIEPGVAYRLLIAFTGYEIVKKDFTLNTDQNTLDLGVFRLSPSSRTLDEMVITAERPPVVVRNDTIEFNASSFKTLPNAIVEDLLKKLPGVNIETDGSLTYNGKKVNKLLVNGKEFFGSDPRVAMQNLPAQVVEKVQVAEDKNERRFNPNMADGEIGQVINLTLKKGMNKGYFGKLYAGAGTGSQFQYESGGIVNFFRDTFQLSLLGFSNNINKQSFDYNEINNLGGFGRSGISSYGYSTTDGMSYNNFNVGGATQGLNRNSGGGFNLNHIIGKGNFNFQYFVNEAKNDLIGSNQTTQFLADSFFNKNSHYNSVNQTFSHALNLNYRVIRDTLTTYNIQASGNFRSTNKTFESAQSNRTTSKMISSALVSQEDKATTPSWRIETEYTRKAKRSKNVFSTGTEVRFSDFNNAQYALSSSFLENNGVPFFSTDQFKKTQNSSLNGILEVGYTAFIKDSLFFSFNNMTQLGNSTNAIETYFKNPEGKYSVYQVLLSNGTDMKTFKNETGADLNYWYKQMKFSMGTNVLKYNMQAQFNESDTSIKQDFLKVLPYFSIRRKNASLRYNTSFEPVQVNNLNPAISNANGLLVSSGNIALQPAIKHSLSLHGYTFSPVKNTFMNFWGSFSVTNNGTINSQFIDSNGVITTLPINANNMKNAYVSGSYRKSYKNKTNSKLTYTLQSGLSYAERPIKVNHEIQNYSTYSSNTRLILNFNFKDKIELSQEYGHAPSLNINEKSERLYSQRHVINSGVLLRWPKHFTFKTSYIYTLNQVPASSNGQDIAFGLLNAEIFYTFMKQERATVSLMVYDILKQNTAVNVFATDNALSVSQTNFLQQYFLVSLSYNLKDFKGERPGEKKNHMYWWW